MISIAEISEYQNFLGKVKYKKGKLSYLLVYELGNMVQIC